MMSTKILLDLWLIVKAFAGAFNSEKSLANFAKVHSQI